MLKYRISGKNKEKITKALDQEKTTPSRSQQFLQLLRDCFGGAVPAATDGQIGLAKFQNKLDSAPVENTLSILIFKNFANSNIYLKERYIMAASCTLQLHFLSQ